MENATFAQVEYSINPEDPPQTWRWQALVTSDRPRKESDEVLKKAAVERPMSMHRTKGEAKKDVEKMVDRLQETDPDGGWRGCVQCVYIGAAAADGVVG